MRRNSLLGPLDVQRKRRVELPRQATSLARNVLDGPKARAQEEFTDQDLKVLIDAWRRGKAEYRRECLVWVFRIALTVVVAAALWVSVIIAARWVWRVLLAVLLLVAVASTASGAHTD